MKDRTIRFASLAVLALSFAGEAIVPAAAHATNRDMGFCASRCAALEDCYGNPYATCTTELCYGMDNRWYYKVVRCYLGE